MTKRATSAEKTLRYVRGRKEMRRTKYSVNTAESTNGALPGSMRGRSSGTLFLHGAGRRRKRKRNVRQEVCPLRTSSNGFGSRDLFNRCDRRAKTEEGNMLTALQKSKGFDNLSDFCTLSDFAAVFGISKATAYRMADQGRIPCIRLGKRIILSKNHLKQWIDEEIGFEIPSTSTEDIENG